MSVKAMSWVFEHAKATANDRVVLLVLADHAHDDGTGAYPSQGTIARKARISERTVRDCLRRLEAAGEIEREGTRHGRTGKVVAYRVLLTRQELPDSENRQPDVGNPADSRRLIRQTAADKPLEEPPVKEQPPLNPPHHEEDEGFLRWLDAHSAITGHTQPPVGSKGRAALMASWLARRREGWTEEQLVAAISGAHSDDWRREHAYDTAESILRPTKIGALVNRGEQRQKAERHRTPTEVRA